MVRIFVVGIEIILCFLLQSSVFPHFALAGVVPDCLMILIVTIAYTRGQIPGLFTGLFAGLLVDFYFGDYIGMCGFLYMCVGYLAGYSNKIYDRDDYVMPLGLIAAGEFIYSFFYYFLEFLMRGKINIGFYAYRIILPKMIYTVLAGIILYKLFQMMHTVLTKLTMKEE